MVGRSVQQLRQLESKFTESRNAVNTLLERGAPSGGAAVVSGASGASGDTSKTGATGATGASDATAASADAPTSASTATAGAAGASEASSAGAGASTPIELHIPLSSSVCPSL